MDKKQQQDTTNISNSQQSFTSERIEQQKDRDVHTSPRPEVLRVARQAIEQLQADLAYLKDK